MKDLLELQDELRLAWLLVECAWMACGTVEAAEPMQVVLGEATEKLVEIREALKIIQAARA